MDRGAIAREGRRAQALDALTFEREREEALRAQLSEVVLEEDAGRVDAEAFARMSPDDVTRVREALGGEDGNDLETTTSRSTTQTSRTTTKTTSTSKRSRGCRVQIERCRASQDALERYVEALDGSR